MTGEPLSLALGRLLGAACRTEFVEDLPDVVVPVPMFWRRRLVRRTSSADLLAREVARQLQVKVSPRAIARTRNTSPQADLPPSQRRSNVRGAFRVRSSTRVKGKHLLIVDDVLTTSATCAEVARVLRRAEARVVSVAVVARTENPFD